eukprot:CAMPEP_0197625426 /NCGR_PEP_ID=MMETSP1338-20131121/4799_1 /TAXON_ID=43686 ORGANISM="Pelagodinium beii, Strain RCC1491" /NCGR_SAMPLE_ID=MMETSP1338 /ASSEMBLY_ACC=CAM_ASM_000754 /LENGTH=39 /DNA_ID= /DNA_START= /DNA_END= /DNA_ORIENTATION=
METGLCSSSHPGASKAFAQRHGLPFELCRSKAESEKGFV